MQQLYPLVPCLILSLGSILSFSTSNTDCVSHRTSHEQHIHKSAQLLVTWQTVWLQRFWEQESGISNTFYFAVLWQNLSLFFWGWISTKVFSVYLWLLGNSLSGPLKLGEAPASATPFQVVGLKVLASMAWPQIHFLKCTCNYKLLKKAFLSYLLVSHAFLGRGSLLQKQINKPFGTALKWIIKAMLHLFQGRLCVNL